jgi:iron(III) transport system ATP-binding protein
MPVPISIRALTKAYGDGPPAVDAVDLEIEAGELFFLLGPSGCGKTTLLRMIAGFVEPTAGRIGFGEHDVTHTPPNFRNAAMVFQSYALWPHMTVEQNVAFGLDVRGVPRPEKASAVAKALRSVRMQELAARKPTQLSGGQQQRVALARALVVRPDILLLDEPLSNLDAALRNELRLEIRRVCKDAGLTAVYVTHDQKEALSIADRIAVMQAGRLMQVGTPRQLYRRPASPFVASFLGETNFIKATVVGADAGLPYILQTSAGVLHGRAPQGSRLPHDARAICSFRPESVRLSPETPDAMVRGKVLGSEYLGNAAYYQVQLGRPEAEVVVRVMELNPPDKPLFPVGSSVSLTVAAEDVAVFPDETQPGPAGPPTGLARPSAGPSQGSKVATRPLKPSAG